MSRSIGGERIFANRGAYVFDYPIDLHCGISVGRYPGALSRTQLGNLALIDECPHSPPAVIDLVSKVNGTVALTNWPGIDVGA